MTGFNIQLIFLNREKIKKKINWEQFLKHNTNGKKKPTGF